MGLFTAKEFAKDEVITIYVGEKTDLDDDFAYDIVVKFDKNGKLVRSLEEEVNIDGQVVVNRYLRPETQNKGLYLGAHYANDKFFGAKMDSNIRFHREVVNLKTNNTKIDRNDITLKARRKILKGEEITWNYNDYDSEEKVSNTILV